MTSRKVKALSDESLVLSKNKDEATAFELVPFLPKVTDNQTIKLELLDLQIDGTISKSVTGLVINFVVQGACDEILWPLKNYTPQRKDNLWQHTCFELFISDTDNKPYVEYNFSPSFDWNATLFHDYRKPSGPANCEPPQNKILQRSGSRHEYQIALPLTKFETVQPLNLGITTIIESNDSQMLYFALIHTADKPDFHRRDSFVLNL